MAVRLGDGMLFWDEGTCSRGDIFFILCLLNPGTLIDFGVHVASRICIRRSFGVDIPPPFPQRFAPVTLSRANVSLV